MSINQFYRNIFSWGDCQVVKDGAVYIIDHPNSDALGDNLDICNIYNINHVNLNGFFYTRNFIEFLTSCYFCERQYNISYLNHNGNSFFFEIFNQHVQTNFERFSICSECFVYERPTGTRGCVNIRVSAKSDYRIVVANIRFLGEVEYDIDSYLFFTSEGASENKNIIKRMFDNLPNHFASIFEIFDEGDFEESN